MQKLAGRGFVLSQCSGIIDPPMHSKTAMRLDKRGTQAVFCNRKTSSTAATAAARFDKTALPIASLRRPKATSAAK